MDGPVQLFTVIVLISIPTVMFGGFSLLRLIPKEKLTDFQHTYFRAGHAHAGVLLVLSLVTLDILGRPGLGISAGLQWTVCLLLLVGVLAQSGGFFVHMAVGQPGAWSRGNSLSTAGAILFAVALLLVAYSVATA
ncbi:MAG TPA: hypothetical protein VLJ59_12505 [Mycobacteriales bacterium]|nr:hypothetical protein [Mycobacteriales bacterium]